MAVPGPASSQSTTQDPLRLSINTAQNHHSSRDGDQSLPGPKTSTGIPNDITKYGGKFNQGFQNQNRNPSLPLKLSQQNGESPTTTHPKTAPIRKDSGFKLPSIAYSPNPNNHEDDSEDEEDDDDDEENGEIDSPPRKIQARSTMTLAPPKLPLLFFEEDSIGQIDFAYQGSGAPSSTHSQTDLTLQNKKSQEKVNTQDARSTEENQDISSTEESEPALVRKTSPKPFTPHINTAFKKKKVPTYTTEQVHSPEKEDGDTSGSQAGRQNSFYWNGSESSTDNEEEDEETTKDEKDGESLGSKSKEGEEEDDDDESTANRVREPLTIKPIIATLPESSLTSATALGFGGPSDWQHFTDYDAEEVDDLALYTSDKPKTAELPAGTPVKEDAERLESSLSPRRLMAAERETLPTIQERTSELLDDAKSSDGTQTKASGRSSAAWSGSRGSIRKSVVEEQTRSSSVAESEDSRASNAQTATPPDTKAPDTEKNNHTPENKTPDSRTDSQVLEKKGPIPAHMAHSRVTSNPSIQSSGLNSPIDEDDGRERIIISLQVPDSPEPEKKKEPSPPAVSHSEERPRERNLAVGTNLEPKIVESPDMLRTGRMSVFPQSIEMEDPYAGLDPWAKASLNRYVKLLKEEAAAQTDEEKFTLFINFMDRERRNRTALYDMDEDSENESTVQFNKVADGKGGLRSRVSLKRKAAPVIPSVDTMPTKAPQPQQPVRADTLPLERSAGSNERQGSEISLTANNKNAAQPPMTAPPQQTNFTGNSNSNGEESFVMVENPSEEKLKTKQVKEKNSGTLNERDCPITTREKVIPSSKERSGGKTGLSLSALKKKALDLGGRSIAKDRNTTPINLQTLLMKASDDSKKPASPIKTGQRNSVLVQEPEPPAIVAPEKREVKPAPVAKVEKNEVGEGRAYEGDKAANRQTIYRPFSGLLRQSSVLRGSNPESKRSSVFDRKSLAAETALSRSPINNNDKPFEEHQKPRNQPVNYRYTILDPLLLVIPQEGVVHTEPHQLSHLRQSMDAIRDDFSFIHKTVLSWDAEAKKLREQNERERHTRTTQNEARIDALFNDNEIGYGDISQLEADFKRQEATKKAEEDREEVSTFVTDVFDVVWARINYEMDQLQPLYDQCTELVSSASAGRSMFEDFEDTIPVAPGMEILLILYQKLMVRHQKAFEAVLERDRRLKKTEVAPWYAMGSIEKVKKIEKRFEDAEKKAILEFCRQRDERANLLMDVLDQNTLRGVGANQDYMESIMQAVRKISTEIQADGSSIANEDVVSMDEVLKAKTITTALARSSEQIVQTFHVADMLLNAADYEVSVANAKLGNADAAAFKRLREAKAKEDNKLAMDLEHRMSLIRGDTARTQEEIGKLLSLISKQHGNGESERSDTERQNNASTSGGEGQDRTSRILSRAADETNTTTKTRRGAPWKQ